MLDDIIVFNNSAEPIGVELIKVDEIKGVTVGPLETSKISNAYCNQVWISKAEIPEDKPMSLADFSLEELLDEIKNRYDELKDLYWC